MDALAEDAPGALQATVRVGLATDPASYLVEVPWEAARLRAEVLLAAFLDDITCPSKAHLLRPFRHALRVLAHHLAHWSG